MVLGVTNVFTPVNTNVFTPATDLIGYTVTATLTKEAMREEWKAWFINEVINLDDAKVEIEWWFKWNGLSESNWSGPLPQGGGDIE